MSAQRAEWRVIICISSHQPCFSSDFSALLRILSEGNGQTLRNSGVRPSDACEVRMQWAEGAEGPPKVSYVLFRKFGFASGAHRLGTAKGLPWGAQAGLSLSRSPCGPPQITNTIYE